MALENLFEFTILGVGTTYEEAYKDAESKLPAPVGDVSMYSKLQMSRGYSCTDDIHEVKIMYNLRKLDNNLN